MKVLFLDIDGVLNKDGTQEKFRDFTGIDQTLLTRYLSWKESRSEVDVVLSSTWRQVDVFMDHLREKDISWISETPYLREVDRGLEIAYWLNANKDKKITHIAILDDVNNMKPVARYLVQTSPLHGLLDRHLKRVDKLLGYD